MRTLIATTLVTALAAVGCQDTAPHNAGGVGSYRESTNASMHNLGDNAASVSGQRGGDMSGVRANPIGGAPTDAGNRGEPVRQYNPANPSGGASPTDGTGVGNAGQGSKPGGGVNANDANGNVTGSGNSGR